MADPRSFSEDDLDRLASLIAEPLLRAAGAVAGSPGPNSRAARLRSPVRPEPPTRGGAGRGPAPSAAPKGRVQRSASPRSGKAATIEVGVGVSNRHVHVSESDARALFAGPLTVVTIEGPKGRIEGCSRRRTGAGRHPGRARAERRTAPRDRPPGRRLGIVQTGRGTRRRLITEREIIELARRGEAIPPDALLTPSARDRAKALGLRLP